jgi:5-methylcytosine-specific restriction endonuclease McrA
MALRRTFRVLSARGPRGMRPTKTRRKEQGRHQKKAVKRATLRDCHRRCVYCAAGLTPETATLDHVHPASRGGTNDPGNLVAACRSCNQLKGDLLPLEFFIRYPWAGANFMRYAKAVHRAFKRGARRVVSLALARAA